MNNYSFTVEDGKAGVRLDLYLVGHLPRTMSRTYLQKLIGREKVRVNGAPQKSRYKVEKGDFVEVEIPKPVPTEIKAENIPINIIFEDDRLIAVDKPAGMVVHPAPGNYSGTLANALLYHAKKLSNLTGERPGIVHRLDKGTSGVIIIAKDEAAHAYLARQFQKRTTRKIYLALVEGVVQLDNGVIEHPIGRHVRHRKKMSVKFSASKNAVTHYKVLERFKDKTLLEIRPETGRTHQIRVHAAYIGHPVVGDETYGTKKGHGLIARQALHASEISVTHPATKEPMHFKSPLPADMQELIERLRRQGRE